MPQEDRYITFTNEEVYKALHALCAQKNIALPASSRITHIQREGEEKDTVSMILENPITKELKKENYKDDFMAAALMMYCRASKVPLPKTAQKSILIKNSKVVLRVQVGEI